MDSKICWISSESKYSEISTISRAVIAILIILLYLVCLAVQRSVFRLLKRLPDRHINVIVYAHTVASTVALPPYIASSIARLYFSPLKDFIGEEWCYVSSIGANMYLLYCQYQSFFINLFRYICVVHNQALHRYNITLKALSQTLLYLMIILAALFTLNLDLDTYLPLHICLGTPEKAFLQANAIGNEHKQWTFIKIVQICLNIIYTLMVCNIPDILFLWKCFTLTKHQTERARGMISQEGYHKRKKDDGIVMTVSLIQSVAEIVYNAIFVIYYKLIYEHSSFVFDQIMFMCNIFMYFVILPAFYMNGDSQFRRKLANEGIFSAIVHMMTE